MICVPSVDILTRARLVNTNADTNESESGQFRGSQIDVAVLFASCIQRIPQSNTVWNRFASASCQHILLNRSAPSRATVTVSFITLIMILFIYLTRYHRFHLEPLFPTT